MVKKEWRIDYGNKSFYCTKEEAGALYQYYKQRSHLHTKKVVRLYNPLDYLLNEFFPVLYSWEMFVSSLLVFEVGEHQTLMPAIKEWAMEQFEFHEPELFEDWKDDLDLLDVRVEDHDYGQVIIEVIRVKNTGEHEDG